MLCELCHQKEAVVKYTEAVGENKTTLNLCRACAEEKGLSNPWIDLSKVFGKLIVTLLGEHLILKLDAEKKDKKEEGTVCPVCGLSWSTFQKTRKLGCAACYDAHKAALMVLLRRLHGTNKHIGGSGKTAAKTTPSPSVPVLKRRLKEAVQKEEFELAAELRDRIREAESRFRETGRA